MSPEVTSREAEQPCHGTPSSSGLSWMFRSSRVTSVLCDRSLNCCMELAGKEMCCFLALMPTGVVNTVKVLDTAVTGKICL